MDVKLYTAPCWGCAERTSSLVTGGLPGWVCDASGVAYFTFQRAPVCRACWDFITDPGSWAPGSSAATLVQRLALQVMITRIAR